MGNYWTNPTRHPEDVGVGHIRRTVNFDQTGFGTGFGIPIGALEAGAIPIRAYVTIVTAFNAGTTNVLVLGTDDDDDGFVTTANAAAGVVGNKKEGTGALLGAPLATNEIVYLKYTSTGTAPTTGAAIAILEFLNKREVEGIPFPANP